MRFYKNFLGGFASLVLLSNCASSKEVSVQKTAPAEMQSISAEAYVYAYPMVLMGITRDVSTAVPRASQIRAPANQIANMRAFPDDKFTDVVTPNADTLYSSTWFDLSEEPMILSVPDAGKRYYMMPLLSAWTDVFAAPGSRTTGNSKKDFALVGPNWKGTLPANVQEIKAPTNSVWMIGRTQTNGKADYDRVYAFQDRLRVTPLSQYGQNIPVPMSVPFDLDVDNRTPPVEQVDNMDARTFYTYFANELKRNPPASKDAAMVSKLAAIGIVPGKDFDYAKLSPDAQRALNSGYFAGQEKIVEALRNGAGTELVNGWRLTKVIGSYGDDYLSRAVIAKVGLGANLKQDAIYPMAKTDISGQQLNGGSKYMIRFAKGKLPPVNGFWSLSMYNSRQFFVKNQLGRYAIGDRDKLKFNRDGSLNIYIQAANPGKEKESNWLPAPSGEDFNLVMRLYWPKQAVLDGSWKMPSVERVQEFKNLSENLR